MAAAGVDVTYQVHPGGHDIPDFLNEIKAMLRWGLFKPVVNEPRSWDNQTVATRGQLWDFTYRFAEPTDPDRDVQPVRDPAVDQCRRIGRHRHHGTGCTIHTSTPAIIDCPAAAAGKGISPPRHRCRLVASCLGADDKPAGQALPMAASTSGGRSGVGLVRLFGAGHPWPADPVHGVTDESVSATLRIKAPAEAVFATIADPASPRRHRRHGLGPRSPDPNP